MHGCYCETLLEILSYTYFTIGRGFSHIEEVVYLFVVTAGINIDKRCHRSLLVQSELLSLDLLSFSQPRCNTDITLIKHQMCRKPSNLPWRNGNSKSWIGMLSKQDFPSGSAANSTRSPWAITLNILTPSTPLTWVVPSCMSSAQRGLHLNDLQTQSGV